MEAHMPQLNRFCDFVFVPLVVGVATAGLFYEIQHFFPIIQPKPSRYLLESLSFATYVMCFISYYQTITISNRLPRNLLFPRLKNNLYISPYNHPIYLQKKQCNQQNNIYKPPRTSHCHVCGCVTRMDHHCPYTRGCIGGNNFKAFILFCFYGGIFAMQFLILSVMFYNKLSDGKVDFGDSSPWKYTILNGIAVILTFSMNGLWLSNLTLAFKNISQLQILKGTFKFKDDYLNPNPFNLGSFTNINVLFAGDYWWFWWPSAIIHEHDGSDFPMRPPILIQEFQNVPDSVKDDLYPKIPKTIEQLKQKYWKIYEKTVFIYEKNQYRILGKQSDQTEDEKIEAIYQKPSITDDTQENNAPTLEDLI